MEGNFRIVQLADNEFVIEKEIVATFEYPWYTFKKPKIVSNWRKVDEKGRFISFFNKEAAYRCTSIEVAKDKVREIKKHPIYYTA